MKSKRSAATSPKPGQSRMEKDVLGDTIVLDTSQSDTASQSALSLVDTDSKAGSSNLSGVALPLIKQRVLGQLNGRLQVPLVGLDDAYDKIYRVMEQTIVAPFQWQQVFSDDDQDMTFRGGGSALLIGPRGSGKSLLIDSALNDLHQKYHKQFITVRLSGLVQTDDRLALQEIAKQIESGRRAIEDDERENISLDSIDGSKVYVKDKYRRQNSAAVLERLLFTLSGNANISDVAGKQSETQAEVTKNDNDEQRATVSVLIVLDEFDQFATMQSRQTLLYNLLDIAQSPQNFLGTSPATPNICIIGISSRMTVPEMLEKRVRSRLSHRVIVLPHPKDIAEFWRICSSSLKVVATKRHQKMRFSMGSVRRELISKRGKKQIVNSSVLSDQQVTSRAITMWNAAIDDLYESCDIVKRLVARVFVTSKDPRIVHIQFLSAIRNAGQVKPYIDTSAIARHNLAAFDNDGILERIKGLSELGLMLLVCAARGEIKFSTETTGRSSGASTLAASNQLKRAKPTGVDGDDMEERETHEESPRKLIAAKTSIPAAVNFTMVYDEYLELAGKTRLSEAAAGAVVAMPFRVWSREQALEAWEELDRGGLMVPVADGGGGAVGSGQGEMRVPEVTLRELGEALKWTRSATSDVVRQWCTAL
ncbi:uncharacterized protein V1518DRAFT_415874 [Limtongia smithiae]|uniref:uncharacterized protein n=1 Tax=Limtongia smithiae TaxID=1125753 RepID=UPI0034CF5997